MSRYNTFLSVFIISVIAMVVFLFFYIQVIFGFAISMHEMEGHDPDAFEFFSRIFKPEVVISGLVLGVSSLLYRILGIVHVARSKTVNDGEKALWIIGFIFMGFITSIVFLVMAKGRKFVG